LACWTAVSDGAAGVVTLAAGAVAGVVLAVVSVLSAGAGAATVLGVGFDGVAEISAAVGGGTMLVSGTGTAASIANSAALFCVGVVWANALEVETVRNVAATAIRTRSNPPRLIACRPVESFRIPLTFRSISRRNCSTLEQLCSQVRAACHGTFAKVSTSSARAAPRHHFDCPQHNTAGGSAVPCVWFREQKPAKYSIARARHDSSAEYTHGAQATSVTPNGSRQTDRETDRLQCAPWPAGRFCVCMSPDRNGSINIQRLSDANRV